MNEVQDALGRMEARSWCEYLAALHRAQRRSGTRIVYTSLKMFDADDAGHPLGRGMPTGRTLRRDGESHRDAWARVVRGDPCSYCGRPESGTVDHIVPKARRPRHAPVCAAGAVEALGGSHSWLNFAAACESCNGGKATRDLLGYLLRRR